MNEQVSSRSLLQEFSVGIVAINKPLNSNKIEVSPIESLTMLNGELTDHFEELTARGLDGAGNSYESKVKVSATLTASWLPRGQSNRMTAPDVRRGEKVQIYRLANSNKFFWDTLENSSNVRRLETVVHAYSATQEEDARLDNTNSYTQGVSTHNKHINLAHTTKANGEKFAYDIFVDAANNTITLKDDVGNFILLKSDTNTVRMQNANGNYLDITGDNAEWFVKSSITVKTQNWRLQTTRMHNSGELLQQGNQVHQGNIALAGGLSTSAGGGGDGSAVFSGGITTTRDVVSRADVLAGNISLKSHRHRASNATVFEPI